MNKKGFILRFSVNERIQHLLLIVSFTMLFVSGFALKYSSTEAGSFIITMVGGMENRNFVHRVGALLLIFTAFYHLFYILFSQRGKEQFKEILPNGKDFSDLFKKNVKSGKYRAGQKMQYLLVALGAVTMIISGGFLWFHDFTLSTLGTGFFNLIDLFHSQESLMILLVVVLWHIYDVHFRDAFPMDWSWINGEISIERLKKNHPLEYEKLLKEEKLDDE
jgi:formate dehydrogenase gamma subunit